jgi:endonuclease/exonuclease/phosphatase family metal-dependent hydrolase
MAWPEANAHPAGEPLIVDVVSVHLDYLSPSVREGQLRQLTGTLSQRSNPRIVLGDFNSEWSAPDSMVRRLVGDAALQAFEPAADDHATYGDRRIDWILISPDFRFERYETLPDVVSDHRAVMADISLATLDGHPATTTARAADLHAAD